MDEEARWRPYLMVSSAADPSEPNLRILAERDGQPSEKAEV
jgi:hypothetical protein